MTCIDSLGVFGTINFRNKKIIVTYHIDKELDKPIAIAKEEINLNKKLKKAKPFQQNMLGIRRFGL
jgi:hypothetical protein